MPPKQTAYHVRKSVIGHRRINQQKKNNEMEKNNKKHRQLQSFLHYTQAQRKQQKFTEIALIFRLLSKPFLKRNMIITESID